MLFNAISAILPGANVQKVLREKTALLKARINSSIGGIIIVDNQGKKILQNQRAIDPWKIPQDIAGDKDDCLQVQHGYAHDEKY